jgi:hypothetical protein
MKSAVFVFAACVWMVPLIWHGPASAHPGPPASHPGPPDGHPGPPATHPGPHDSDPGPATTHPGPPDKDPGPPAGHPGPTAADPGPPAGHAGPTADDPGPTASHPGPGGHAGHTDCEAARCEAQAEIDARCSCTDESNHGRYVRCVAHATKKLVPPPCRGAVVRCAARSGCGRSRLAPCEIEGTCCVSCVTTTTTTTSTSTTSTTLYGSPSRAFLAPVRSLLD